MLRVFCNKGLKKCKTQIDEATTITTICIQRWILDLLVCKPAGKQAVSWSC